mmetsp:Transcript_16392/g.37798  ORF Transcript_16392/g.37798 Transcript_16392/m.37798 type:complete len:203 (+) Transcript_16392:132-740(+)
MLAIFGRCTGLDRQQLMQRILHSSTSGAPIGQLIFTNSSNLLVTTAAITSDNEPPCKAISPVTTKQASKAKENTSALGVGHSNGRSLISGAAKAGVQPKTRPCLETREDKPKSMTFAFMPLDSTSTFSAFRSPWTMLGAWACRYLTAMHTSSIKLQRPLVVGWPGGFCTTAFRVMPSMNSSTIPISGEATLTYAPWKRTMLG